MYVHCKIFSYKQNISLCQHSYVHLRLSYVHWEYPSLLKCSWNSFFRWCSHINIYRLIQHMLRRQTRWKTICRSRWHSKCRIHKLRLNNFLTLNKPRIHRLHWPRFLLNDKMMWMLFGLPPVVVFIVYYRWLKWLVQ